MTQITINNLNYLVVEKLQILATRNNRTLSEEIKAILEQVTVTKTAEKNYPLREKPIRIADDFDESMPELWDALGE